MSVKPAIHLDRVDSRNRLAPRRDPYWQRVAEGRYIGFRRMSSGASGLSSEAASHFRECAKDKLPDAWLVSRANGNQWKKEAWRDEVKAAAAAAKLPAATVAYTIRHSVITDLMTETDLDIFTIAQISGTSVAMIEKHYGKLRQHRAKAALEKLAKL
jgi:hypothetical protein